MTDADPFEAFVREHQHLVYAVAIRLLGRPAEAEDVAQDVFLKAFERFDALRTSPSAAGWLRTVTRNSCLNHLARYRSRWRLFSEMSSPEHPDAEPFYDQRLGTAPSAGLALERADERERVETALRALPDHQRVPLVLFHFEELSYEEIAEMLGVTLAKVKSDIHRGREALRKSLVAMKPHGSR
jgi:RNA polymerase sigma-70 factor (ECF subfamily)